MCKPDGKISSIRNDIAVCVSSSSGLLNCPFFFVKVYESSIIGLLLRKRDSLVIDINCISLTNNCPRNSEINGGIFRLESALVEEDVGIALLIFRWSTHASAHYFRSTRNFVSPVVTSAFGSRRNCI